MSTPTAPLAALTTIFTPPCAITWLLTSTKFASQYPPFPTTGPASCDPPFWAENLAGKGFDFYSPAICPSGFAVGPGCSITKTRTAEGFPAVQDGETAVYCVPSGHTCTTDTTDFRGGVWGFTGGKATPVTAIAGPALQIRWRDEDLSLLETHPLTPGLALQPSETSASSSPSPPPEDSTITVTAIATQPTPSVLQMTIITGDQITASQSSHPSTFISSRLPSSDIPERATGTSPITSSIFNPTSTSKQETSTQPSAGPATSTTAPNNSQPINQTSLAAVVMSGTLIAIVLAMTSFMCVRRYRRRNRDGSNFDGSKQLSPTIIIARVRRRLFKRRSDDGGVPVYRGKPAAELSGNGIIPELDYKPPLGSTENPAELEGQEANSSHGGWMSRVSRFWSLRSKKTARSSVAESSSARWTRTATSIRTSFSGHDSGDWETFAKAKWPNGLTVPTVALGDRPLPDIPRTPSTEKPSSHLRVDVDATRVSRISDGTFGLPGKSPVSEKSCTAQVVRGDVADFFGSLNIDLAGNAETQALRQYATHKDLLIIYTWRERRQAGIASPMTLKGKKVDICPSTSAAYFTTILANNCNAASCGSGTRPYMLAQPSVDAVGIWEPTLELAMEGLGSHAAVVFQNASIYCEIYNLYTTAERLKDPSTCKYIVAYLRALDQTALLFTSRSETAIPRVAKTINTNEALVKTVWPVHDWKGGLAPDLLDVLVPEDQWVAKVDGRRAISRADLAAMTDSKCAPGG
ncbi:hypothetical protein SCARD494_12851 [Seiridium cardinale]